MTLSLSEVLEQIGQRAASSSRILDPQYVGERHYAICKGTTVVQVTGVGPFDINFVNPEDAPKK